MAGNFRFRTVFTGVAGTPWYSNIYFRQGGASVDDCGAALTTFWEAVDAVIFTGVDWAIESAVPILEDSTNEITSVTSWAGADGSGANAAEPLPYSNQAVILWNTGLYTGGRQLQGKCFVPGLTQTANDSGQLLAATQATIQTAALALVNDASSVLTVTSPTNLTSGIVNDTVVSRVIGVLRSRRD
uniref:Uncharacterized protein n=1 Tax=uncultured prokaryote TaxID=198431 RepID=A0A0H5Q6A1_9ZZZZ|nr:hypothetical protein [uncultured prokaryote]